MKATLAIVMTIFEMSYYAPKKIEKLNAQPKAKLDIFALIIDSKKTDFLPDKKTKPRARL